MRGDRVRERGRERGGGRGAVKLTDLSMVPYKGSEIGKNGEEWEAEVGVGEKNGKLGAGLAATGARYWECMKNHAAGLGAQAFDGCAEFMPGGEPGSLEALKCAACGCHRNFHRKEVWGGACGDYVSYDHTHQRHHPLLLYNAADSSSPKFPFFRHPLPPMLPLPAPQAFQPLAFSTPTGMAAPVEGNRGSETPSPPPAPSVFMPELAREREPSRKRFRTKFTQEQKEEMQKFAEKVGWRIQRHDNDELQEFCTKVGVKRQVLKVWMQNNKGALSGGAAARAEGPSKGDSAPAIRVLEQQHPTP